MNINRRKFRVWDEKEKQYKKSGFLLSNDGSLLQESGWNDSPNGTENGRFFVEECTGVNEKNRELIFVGDILRVYDPCGNSNHENDCETGVGPVEFLEDYGFFYITGEVENALYDVKNRGYYFEVIGNIHEGVKA